MPDNTTFLLHLYVDGGKPRHILVPQPLLQSANGRNFRSYHYRASRCYKSRFYPTSGDWLVSGSVTYNLHPRGRILQICFGYQLPPIPCLVTKLGNRLPKVTKFGNQGRLLVTTGYQPRLPNPVTSYHWLPLSVTKPGYRLPLNCRNFSVIFAGNLHMPTPGLSLCIFYHI